MLTQWARQVWVIKCVCKLSVPNENDRTVGSAAHVYYSESLLLTVLCKHTINDYSYWACPCELLSVTVNCQYRMNTVGQLGQLHTCRIARKLFLTILYKHAINDYNYCVKNCPVFRRSYRWWFLSPCPFSWPMFQDTRSTADCRY